MTAVRIAHAEPRPGHLGNGVFITSGFLVVLADDAGHRALPIWFRGYPGGGSLAKLMGRETDDLAPAIAAEELTDRLFHAAGACVTGVDIDVAEAAGDELGLGSFAARIELAGAGGTRPLAVPFGLGLAMAAAAGAPVRVSDSVLDQRAIAVPGDERRGGYPGHLRSAAGKATGRAPVST